MRIFIANPGMAGKLWLTVCNRAHPVWCAFFLYNTDEDFAWAGLIGLNVPSAAIGPRFPGAGTGD